MRNILASEASAHNLAIGLKNAANIIDTVLDIVQFSVNEQCSQYSECAAWTKFISAGKPVFHIEYPQGAGSSVSVNTAQWCSKDSTGTNISDFSTVIKTQELNGWVEYCDGQVNTTQVIEH
jgi:hypothetical protein